MSSLFFGACGIKGANEFIHGDNVLLEVNSVEGEVTSPSINEGSSSKISVYPDSVYEIIAIAKANYLFDYWSYKNHGSTIRVTLEIQDSRSPKTTFKVIGLKQANDTFFGRITAHFKKKPVASTEIVIKIKTTECGTVTPKEKTLSKPASGRPDHV